MLLALIHLAFCLSICLRLNSYNSFFDNILNHSAILPHIIYFNCRLLQHEVSPLSKTPEKNYITNSNLLQTQIEGDCKNKYCIDLCAVNIEGSLFKN